MSEREEASKGSEDEEGGRSEEGSWEWGNNAPLDNEPTFATSIRLRYVTREDGKTMLLWPMNQHLALHRLMQSQTRFVTRENEIL